MKKIISSMIIFQFLIPIQAFAAKDKTKFDSKKCGDFVIISDVDSTNQIEVCRLDNGVMDRELHTREAKTVIHAPDAIVESAKSSSQVIDIVLLQEVRARAQKKLEGLKKIEELPENDQTHELKENAKWLKEFVLSNKHSAIHQIRTILSVYPDIEDDLVKENPDYKSLLCKYEVWKHRREILNKVAKITSKIVTIALILGTAATGIGFFGLLSMASMGPIMIALGATEVGAGGFQIYGSLLNWDDVRAGKLAKHLLSLNSGVNDYIKELQKDPTKNAVLIKEFQEITLSKKDIEDLKDIKKLKNDRIKELINGSFKVLIGASTVAGGVFLKSRFSEFKTDGPANPVNTTGPNPLPGSGGNDGGGGFLTDDGG